MGLGGWLFASVYDRITAGTEAAGLRAHRERLLEIGAGTGADVPFYGDAVETIMLAEPDCPMARRL